jgi:hypothetical protein
MDLFVKRNSSLRKCCSLSVFLDHLLPCGLFYFTPNCCVNWKDKNFTIKPANRRLLSGFKAAEDFSDLLNNPITSDSKTAYSLNPLQPDEIQQKIFMYAFDVLCINRSICPGC